MHLTKIRQVISHDVKQEENFYGLQTARQPEAETAAHRRNYPVVANPD
jgi:hypothetical protein